MKKTIALIAALVVAGVQANAAWTVSNALDVAADLDKVDTFDVFSGATGDPGTLTLVEDPTGTLKNPDGSPAIVVEAKGSQTDASFFVQSYNFPAPAPTDSVYTFYYRWMYPEGGAVSHQELAPLAGEDEVLNNGAVQQANGPWFHNWWDLAFAYNGGGTWEVGSDAGGFTAGTWYEYWLVVDPANVSFDWYIRGGTEYPDVTPVFLDGLYANLDTTDPLKALQEYHWMGQEGFFGPQYYDAMFIDTTGENMTTPEGLSPIVGSTWTVSNALDVAADLDKVDIFDVFSGATGDPGTLTLVEDPTGTLKNPDGSPAIVVEAKGSQTAESFFVQSYNFPAPAPTDSVYTFYYRWMYPEGGAVSHQELAIFAGEDEVLNNGAVLQANGPWFHNWWDLAFAYNGGGTWEVGSDAGGFTAGTWYEYWLVIDPANVSFDWYIRGGTEYPDVTPVFLDGLYANLDTTDPLKALQEYHWMGQEGFFGPQYYDAMFIDTTGENMTTPEGLSPIVADTWTVSNALDVAADLDKVDTFDVFSGATGDPGTLTLVEDPTGTLKNPDGSPAIVVEAKGSQTAESFFVQSYNFPAPAPTDSVYTFYYRWMYPEGGAVSHQELAIFAGEDEVLNNGAVLQANGPWFHNWWDLAFAYNGGGTWEVGSDAGGFTAGTWYEYWLVIDPANVSFDWYIRGGTEYPDVTPVFLDGLYANLDTTDPLKALQEYHWMGQEGFFGPQYYDAMFIDTTGENMSTPSGLGSIFGGTGSNDPLIGGTPIDGLTDWYLSEWFGAYNTTGAPWLFHADHGFVYHNPGSTNDSIFFYDDAMQTWWWTNETDYPFLYAFDPPADNAGTDIGDEWLFYFDGTSGPRSFGVVTGASAGSFLFFNP